MTLKFIIPTFPKVPFIDRYDYWNGLATHRKITVSNSLHAIRLRFHRLAFPDSAVVATTPLDDFADEEQPSQGATNSILPNCPHCGGFGTVRSASGVDWDLCPLCSVSTFNAVVFTYIDNTLVSNPPFFNLVSWLKRSSSLLYFQCVHAFRVQASKSFERVGG